MKPLRYGQEIANYETHPHVQFTEINLLKGYEITTSKRAKSRPRLVALYDMNGITVEVTDQSTTAHIYDLTRTGQDKAEAEQYLERVFWIALQQNPSYLEERLAAEFERGVVEGRKQKVKEFRKVLSD